MRERREAELHGWEVPAAPQPGSDGPGNSAWQRAQQLALQVNAQQRRN